MSELILRNRQRARKIDFSLLGGIARTLLQELLAVGDYELGVHLVAARAMARLNRAYLRQDGSTDVITFDYRAIVGPASRLPECKPTETRGGRKTHPARPAPVRGLIRLEVPTLHGDIFISVDDAVAHAHRYRTTWQEEIVRYLVHGILHLGGHDDMRPRARRKMKRDENHLVRELALRFPLHKLSRRSSSHRRSSRRLTLFAVGKSIGTF